MKFRDSFDMYLQVNLTLIIPKFSAYSPSVLTAISTHVEHEQNAQIGGQDPN